MDKEQIFIDFQFEINGYLQNLMKDLRGEKLYQIYGRLFWDRKGIQPYVDYSKPFLNKIKYNELRHWRKFKDNLMEQVLENESLLIDFCEKNKEDIKKGLMELMPLGNFTSKNLGSRYNQLIENPRGYPFGIFFGDIWGKLAKDFVEAYKNLKETVLN